MACVGAKLALDAEVDFAGSVVADVAFGPQTGKRLADRSHRILHCSRSDLFAAGRDSPVAVSGTEDLQERHFVAEVGEVGIDAKLGTVLTPSLPVLVRGGGSARNDSGADRVLNNAEIRAECIAGRRGQSCQEASCG